MGHAIVERWSGTYIHTSMQTYGPWAWPSFLLRDAVERASRQAWCRVSSVCRWVGAGGMGGMRRRRRCCAFWGFQGTGVTWCVWDVQARSLRFTRRGVVGGRDSISRRAADRPVDRSRGRLGCRSPRAHQGKGGGAPIRSMEQCRMDDTTGAQYVPEGMGRVAKIDRSRRETPMPTHHARSRSFDGLSVSPSSV